MGLLILMIPIVIYFFVLKKLLGGYDETKRKLKKRTLFILLFTLPFWDHIIGYTYYKYLCYSQGGIKVYQTVTDVQEQRDYWFKDNITGGVLDKRAKSYTDLDRTLEQLETPFSKKVVFKKLLNNKYSTGYLNYCKEKYNDLPNTHPNYKKSCTYTKELIIEYKLENVIKVPKSPYGLYISNFDKNYKYKILPFLQVTSSVVEVLNNDTNSTLIISKSYGFGGGWYIKLISPYPFSIGCADKAEKSLKNFQEFVIPNPYK